LDITVVLHHTPTHGKNFSMRHMWALKGPIFPIMAVCDGLVMIFVVSKK
jgi:hypothetical protein